ncbi:non-specific serine/threonine protein kinase [Malassezia sp. CBS 17886]|nr:non-specific serine/threonine protein kinase [Malassezia sp. CBS 17886]
MKLDATDVRYLSPEEFRVLTAVEMGSKNHEVVPSTLIAQISALRHAGIAKVLSSLAKRKLVARVQNNTYDGFRLTYGGYDFLAVRAMSKRKSVYGIGNQIGVGKESDIYVVSTEDGETRVLKIHRLGRISFRKIKEKRDYLGKRKSASWMYMSRLAAQKEYAFMQILHEHGFPVPTPLDQTRHTILMSFEDAYPLRQIASLPVGQVRVLYGALMQLIVRLAHAGLIHGDFNEFNLLVRELRPSEDGASSAGDGEEEGPGSPPGDSAQGSGVTRIVEPPPAAPAPSAPGDADEDSLAGSDSDGYEADNDAIELGDGVQVEPVLIDFPQMVSIEHPNAEDYFNRDVDCVRRFFRKRFRFESDEYPRFAEVVASVAQRTQATPRLDALAHASGYGKACVDDAALEEHMRALRTDADGSADEESGAGHSGEDSEDDGEASDDEATEDEGGDGATQHGAKGKPAPSVHDRAPLDASGVSARVAASQVRHTRRSEKHHGRKAQATKTGRRHGGGKAKHNKERAVADSLAF